MLSKIIYMGGGRYNDKNIDKKVQFITFVTLHMQKFSLGHMSPALTKKPLVVFVAPVVHSSRLLQLPKL